MSETCAGWRPGSRLGRYEILGFLARGGMAEIHLARARGIEGFQKLVVLKRMLPQSVSDDDLVRLFLDEARLAATLEHPNIAQVHDIGFEDDSHFFAMEHVHGADLRRVFEAAASRGGVPVAQAVTLAAGIAAGLHYAHERRAADGTPLEIVHRDVSPSNVLVSFDGAVKLADFGVARIAARQTHGESGLRGKASYMSPEQGRGELPDRRSDVFALGIILWELVTNRRLFAGDDPLGTLRRIADFDAASAREVRADLPVGLDAIIRRALMRERERRYASARAMQIDLEELARSERWGLSSIALAEMMRRLFAEEVSQWSDATRAGQSLAEHLTSTMGTGCPPPPVLGAFGQAAEPQSARRRTRRRLGAAVALAILGAGGTAGAFWLMRARTAKQAVAPPAALAATREPPAPGSHPPRAEVSPDVAKPDVTTRPAPGRARPRPQVSSDHASKVGPGITSRPRRETIPRDKSRSSSPSIPTIPTSPTIASPAEAPEASPIPTTLTASSAPAPATEPSSPLPPLVEPRPTPPTPSWDPDSPFAR